MNRCLIPLVLATVALLAGCVAPKAIEPTLSFQREAARRLSEACAQDSALLRAQIERALAVQRTLLLGRLHRVPDDPLVETL